MPEGYLSNSCSSECYFEYKMNRVVGNESIALPKLYFERDYFQPGMPYTLFAVPQEWLEVSGTEGDGVTPKDFDYLPYDSIELVYDVSGLECAPLADHNSSEYRDAEIHNPSAGHNVIAFYKEKCRINITSQNEPVSGVGVMDMYKGLDSKSKRLVARFFFIVNFSFKTKIKYSITQVGTKLNINFECKQRPRNIKVRVTYAEGRIPCLENDKGSYLETVDLKFDRDKFSYSKELGSRFAANTVFSVALDGDEATKYYMLHCERNDTVRMSKIKPKNHAVVYTCPFCHQKIDSKTYGNARYRRGGISCTYLAQHTPIPTVLDSDGNKMRNCLFCANDLEADGSGSFSDGYYRLIPQDFMKHDSYKVAFLGSARAGKTTFVSRFFDLTGDDMKSQMNMTMIHNALAEIGVSAHPAHIQNLEWVDDMLYQYDLSNWMSDKEYYTNRSIDLLNGKYPGATTTGEAGFGRNPFIAEVNKDVYVSFYDVAGEDAETKEMVSAIAGGENEYIGVFCVVSGTTNFDGNAAVFDNLLHSRIHRDSPIAVIVTKFDTLKDHFDSSCHCKRTDYIDGTKFYQGSNLQHEIDYSSEEIKSYLMRYRLYHDLSSKFSNVKFFGVSSFNFKDSIHKDDERLEDQGHVRFGCSASRMELPFIWMLNQFGVIK